MVQKSFDKFEEMVASFFSKVEGSRSYEVSRNVKIEGPDGPRQIDVLLEGKIGPLDVRTIIECKDYKGIVNVQKIDELASKMNDVKAHKAVLISAKGFSKTAVQKAKRLGIELCTLAEALSEKWRPTIDIPILVEEVVPEISVTLNIHLTKGAHIARNFLVNDIDINVALQNMWNQKTPVMPVEGTLPPEDLGIIAPYFLRDSVTQEQLPFTHLELYIKHTKSYFYGNLSLLPNTMILDSIIKGEKNIVFDANHLLNYRHAFAKYSSVDSIPNHQALQIKCLAKPIIDMQTNGFELSLKKLK